MVWIDSSPYLQVPLPEDEEIVNSIYIPNSPILVVLTRSTIYLFNKSTFLPLGVHQRSDDSIEAHGSNVNVKTKHIHSYNMTHQFKDFNLFIQTNLDYLIIYQIQVNYEQPIYEINSTTDDQLIQSGLPLLTRKVKFSLSNLIKSATNLIINSNFVLMPNLINPENLNNAYVIENHLTPHVELVKSFKIFKIVKLEEACTDYWVLTDSHDVLLYNSKNVLQLINIKTFSSDDLGVANFEWYTSSSDISYFTYNMHSDYCIFFNTLGQGWYYSVRDAIGYQIFGDSEGSLIPQVSADSVYSGDIDISYNPQFDLLLIQSSNSIKLYEFNQRMKKLEFFKEIATTENRNKITWAPNGEFFVSLDERTGFWTLYSKFGKQTFQSKDYLKLNIASASSVLISESSISLYIVNKEGTQMSSIRLLTANGGAYFNSEYLSLINYKAFNKFPLLAHFKHAMADSTLDFKISRNVSNQLSVSIGTHLAVSTPMLSDGINHTLWFNFDNYSVDKQRIMNHFWFNDYLIVINRKHITDETEDNSIPMFDEVLILNTKNSKYGHAGKVFTFNNDAIVWNHNFNKSLFLNVEIVHNDPTSSNLIIVTDDLKLIILEITNTKSREDVGEIGNLKNYDVYVQLLKVIHLDSINTKLLINSIVQSSFIFKKHFLFLLNTGELYLLKNTSVTDNKTNYNLTLIHKLVEKFQLIDICDEGYLYVQDVDLLVYKLDELVQEILQPIRIPVEEQFLELTDSLESIFLETVVTEHSFLSSKVSKQLTLHKFIEYYLINDPSKISRFKDFKHYNYSLELLLFNYLLNNDENLLKKLIQVIDDKSIFINCFRKIEVKYWKSFFILLDTTPLKFMDDLISSGNVELCYNYLVIYLNSKTDEAEDDNSDLLTSHEHKLILSIMTMLEKAERWEWCFELCRFVKIMEPNGRLLDEIQRRLQAD